MTSRAIMKPRISNLTLGSIKPLLALIVVLIFTAACASNQSGDDYKDSEKRKAAESNTALGLEYMKRGQYEVALGKLKKAVKEEPGYAPAHTVLAVLYERIGEMNLAGKHYKKAYEADSADGDVNNNYGVYLCKTGKSNQAIEHFLKALDDPFYSTPAIALTNAGSCELGIGNIPEADEYLRSALKMEPDFPDALLNMAKLNFAQQNYLSSRAFMQRYEVAAKHQAESLLLAYRIEMASRDSRAANKYKILLEANFPDSNETAEVRRLSDR
jgi:type IV pilus assembly protein PilF